MATLSSKAMRWLVIGALSCAWSAGTVVFAETAAGSSGKWRGGLNIFYGQKALGNDDWEPIEYQDLVGFQITTGRAGWPLALAFDQIRTYEESSQGGERTKGRTEEWGVGVRKVWEPGARRRTYVGGGIALLKAKITLPEVGRSDSDRGFGPWIDAGVFWRLGSVFGLGFAGRYSWGRVNLFEEERQAGGPQAGFLIGWGWPDSPQPQAEPEVSEE